MIFEKNPFTTAVSMPKSFHLTPEAPTFEIHQPTLLIHQCLLLSKRAALQSDNKPQNIVNISFSWLLLSLLHLSIICCSILQRSCSQAKNLTSDSLWYWRYFSIISFWNLWMIAAELLLLMSWFSFWLTFVFCFLTDESKKFDHWCYLN